MNSHSSGHIFCQIFIYIPFHSSLGKLLARKFWKPEAQFFALQKIKE